LQYASNTKEAMGIAMAHRTFVSESFLIGSANDRRVVLIEKTPDETVLVEPDQDYIVVTNHFQAEEFKEDELNLENMANGTSVYRFDRTRELLSRHIPLSIDGAAKILRDYKGLNDINIGLGNEKAVNQFIAHHSIIFKPEELKVWVAAPPYQLGEYLCYDLEEIFKHGKDRKLNAPVNIIEESIPEDTLLFSQVYADLMKYKKISRQLEDTEPIDFAIDRLINYNPEFFGAYRFIGDYYWEKGQEEKAVHYYRQALKKEPPSEAERRYVEEKLK